MAAAGAIARGYGRRDGVPNALIASAARISLNDRRSVETTRRRKQAWQSEAWDVHDEVGEIGYAVSYIANLMSKLRLFPAMRVTPDQPPIPLDSDDSTFPAQYRQLAIDTLSRLRSSQGGQSAILRELSQNLEVAGELYLHGHSEAATTNDEQLALNDWGQPQAEAVTPDMVEDWQVRSVDELTVQGDQFVLRRGPGSTAGTPIPSTDLVIRLWERHPRFSELSTCAMRRVLAEAEALLLLSREIRAQSKARMNNGLLLVPSELSFGPVDPTRDSGDGEEADDPFDADLNEAMITPVQEEGSASTVVPMVVRGPAEYLKEIRYLTLERPLDAGLEARIEQRILRIARGMDIPAEVITGFQATTFANAAQVRQSEFDDHIEPRAVLVCDAITAGYYQWALEVAGVPEDVASTTFVWFDPEAIIVKPDTAETAGVAFTAGVISPAAYRNALGFTEDDAPDDADSLRHMLLSGKRIDPFVEVQLLIESGLAPADTQLPAPGFGIVGELKSVSALPMPGVNPDAPPPVIVAPRPPVAPGEPVTPPAPPPPTSGSEPVPPKPVTASGTPDKWAKLGPQLSAIDRDLRTRIVGALDQAMRTALDRAGNRIRGKTQRAAGGDRSAARQIADAIPAREVAARLGAEAVHAAGMSDNELVVGSFASVLEDIGHWLDAGYARAVGAVEKAIGPLSAPTRTALDTKHAANMALAHAWLSENLTALAASRLYSPNPDIPPAGEHDGTVLIPVGLVRAALAMAGGTHPKGGGSLVSSAWVDAGGAQPITDGDGHPVGGIGTGGDIMAVITDAGGQVEAWQWVYGQSERSFEPHLTLADTTVESLDDPLWANEAGWPDVPTYFPGDHAGCSCDLGLVIIDGSGDVAPDPAVAELLADDQTPEDEDTDSSPSNEGTRSVSAPSILGKVLADVLTPAADLDATADAAEVADEDDEDEDEPDLVTAPRPARKVKR